MELGPTTSTQNLHFYTQRSTLSPAGTKVLKGNQSCFLAPFLVLPGKTIQGYQELETLIFHCSFFSCYCLSFLNSCIKEEIHLTSLFIALLILTFNIAKNTSSTSLMSERHSSTDQADTKHEE